jgi:UDP-N-acetylmuramate dehydrogenase
MLFTEDTFDGLVIKINILGKSVLQETDKKVIIEVWAGEQRDNFVRRSINQGLAGSENLVSIPGTVWATPVQNIWAYGIEAKDIIVSVTCIDMKTGDSKHLLSEECLFWYRSSIFKTQLHGDFVITSVQFCLAKYNQEQYIWNVNYEWVAERTAEIQQQHTEKTLPRCIATAIAQIRAEKLPDLKKIGTAGSFFQNPLVSVKQYKQLLIRFPSLKWRPNQENNVKLSAGQLIELAWFKGHTQNNVGVYEHHALVLVHHGEGKWAYLLEVINLIRDKVQDLFTVQLIPEVNIIPHYAAT